jgi:hypothetical protein
MSGKARLVVVDLLEPRSHLRFSALFGNSSVKYAEAGAGPWVPKKGSVDVCRVSQSNTCVEDLKCS